ncbi:MAG: cytochrome c biogenesis protein ResB [Pyrinomonadaceae bacterium]
MSLEKVEETQNPRSEKPSASSASGGGFWWYVDGLISFLASVKLGVVLLVILVVLSVIGMLIVQQNVSGFDAFYAGMTPAEKAVYGALGFFDIYHSYYYLGLLCLLSLNILLASIQRFPSAYSYVRNPKKVSSFGWLKGRSNTAEITLSASSKEEAIEKVAAAMRAKGLKPVVSEKDERGLLKEGESVVFGETGKWNRLGAYIVHVFLLTLFLGHFVALITGFDADVRFEPGQSTNEIELIEFNLDEQNRYAVKLPFTIDCVDIQQKLIDPKGPIEVFNTLDWLTSIQIKDPKYGTKEAVVSLNNPLQYRGYRFFQAQTVPLGSARSINLLLTPEKGGDPQTVKIPRNGKTTLGDGTEIKFEQFLPDFTFNEKGQPDTKSGDYNNPAAVLQVIPKGGQPERIFAFATDLPDDAPIGAPKAGFKWKLSSFERSPFAHVLSIKYDPYNGSFIAWYIGGWGLILALIYVFFFSHRRYWALIKPNGGKFEVLLAGEANRNQQGFDMSFKKLEEEIRTSSAS